MSQGSQRSWQATIEHLLFNNEQIMRLEDSKYLLQNEFKDKQVQELKEKINSNTMFNLTISMAGAIATVRFFQKCFRSSYGRTINIGYFFTDLSIFFLWMGSAMFYSLSVLDSDIQEVRKKWILGHDEKYLKQMQVMRKEFDISLQEQIKPYVPKKEQLNWKIKYDDLLK